jgi:hypothetical protein
MERSSATVSCDRIAESSNVNLTFRIGSFAVLQFAFLPSRTRNFVIWLVRSESVSESVFWNRFCQKLKEFWIVSLQEVASQSPPVLCEGLLVARGKD